jgi:hypothetical protein
MQPPARPTYTVNARFADGWWTIRLDGEVDVTARVRFLDEVEPQARRAIALVRSVPQDSFDVVVEADNHPALP